jgi:hypothetical protein
MRATVLLDQERPKVSLGEVREILRKAGLKFSTDNPEIGVVIGGDGVFSYYGRMQDIPLLFVGVRSAQVTGSKAFLAEAYFDELEDALIGVRDGRYTVVRHKRLEVRKNGRRLGEVFTDVYLQRGVESNGLRYRVEVSGGQSFGESAIGDGVAICTRAGSTGYYSYPDKIRTGDWLESGRYTIIGDDEIGVCHIVPTFTSRDGSALQPLRYTLPWESEVNVRLVREADARLYGVTEDRRGVRVGVKDLLAVLPSKGTTRLIKLGAHLESKS